MKPVFGGAVVLTEESLDELAERFLFYRVREFIGISFEQFLSNPEYYIGKTCVVIRAVLDVDGRYCPVMERKGLFCTAWISYAAHEGNYA